MFYLKRFLWFCDVKKNNKKNNLLNFDTLQQTNFLV